MTSFSGFQEPLKTLCSMLTYRRAAGSKAEEKFISRFIKPLGAKPDNFGNYILRIGDSPVLFSSHTDSVHHSGGKQQLRIKNGILTAKPVKTPAKSVRYFDVKANAWRTYSYTPRGCLGADDGVGCWIMCEMAKAGVPGLYIWHRQEESGGCGSSHIAKTTPDVLKDIQAAIAFDRKGYTDVITHQAGYRGASDDFAESLAALLPGAYKPSRHGIFTDTANYTDHIGECTNISVGYFDEHTQDERLHLGHAMALRASMVTFDHTKLVFKRKPGEHSRYSYHYGQGGYGSSGLYGENGNDWWEDYYEAAPNVWKRKPTKDRQQARDEVFDEGQEGLTATRGQYSQYEKMSHLVRDNPAEVADLLIDYGFDLDSLTDELSQRGAIVLKG